MEKWSFCDDNDNLIRLVIDGKKVATTSNYDPNELPNVGEKSMILYSDETSACIIETISFEIIKFGKISSSLSDLEGEGSYEEWKSNHERIFKYYDSTFNDETLVVFERFKLIEILNKK